MYSSTIKSSTGNSVTSGGVTTFTLTADTGKKVVSAGWNMSHTDKAHVDTSRPTSDTTWEFKFGNFSGTTVTVDLYILQVPESEQVSVLRVKP